MEAVSPARSVAPRTWRDLRWLTPWRCRVIFAALLIWGAWSHVQYLSNDCPLDLSGDEAQYWDWSRQLGLSYYSKGPLIAYLIAASTRLFGSTMPAVRYPAIALATGTAICSYWLIVKLFRSDRLALGAALLSACVPVFVAGSILMTIDPPFYFCWALATCLAAKAIFDEARWLWPVVGAVLGIGFLAKYAMFLWPVGLVVFLLVERRSSRGLRPWRSGWFWSMGPVALLFTIPVLVWNARNGWMSLGHVRQQTGTGFALANVLEFAGGQIAILGPALFIIVAGAVWYGLRKATEDPHRREVRYLLWIGLSFFGIVAADVLRSKVQPNWPAPAYFTLMILATYFLSLRLRAGAPAWGWWRFALGAAVVSGIVLIPVAHDFTVLYRFLPAVNRARAMLGARRPAEARQIDPTYKLRGWGELGAATGRALAESRPGAFVLCDDYQTTAATAFYVPGQPKTYYAGSYFVQGPARLCQYDIWTNRTLEPAKTALIGRDAVYVGYMRKELREAFDAVQRLEDVIIVRRGLEVRRFSLWRMRGFHGLSRAVPLADAEK